MFYRNVMAKYANIRAFEKPDEGAAGGAGEDTSTTTGTEEKTEGASTDEDAQKAAEKAAADAAKAAEGSDDPKLQEAAAEQAALLREVMNKKAKLKTTEEALAAANKNLEAYEGIDPAKIRELLKKEADAERAAAEAKGDFERVKAMMVEEHNRAMKKIQEDLEAEKNSRNEDRSLIDELTVGNAFGNSEFIRADLTISPAKARILYGDHFERQGTKVVAYDKPAGQSDRTMLVNAQGDPLSFDEAISRIVNADPDKKGVLRAKTKPGAASSSDVDRAKPVKQSLSGKSQIAAALRAKAKSA